MALKPPVEVPQGAIRLNTDSQKLEFYAQDQWWEMATDVPTLNGGTRGIFTGGYGSSPYPNMNTIDYITIETAGNAADFGDMTVGRSAKTGGNSRTRGIIQGGRFSPSSDGYNTIDYITFSTTGNAQDFGDLTVRNPAMQGVSNQTRGIFAGGYNQDPSKTHVNTMDYITIASIGNALDFGDLPVGDRVYGYSASSTTRGFWAGGRSPGNWYTNIYFKEIASLGNGNEFGDLTIAKANAAGSMTSSTRAVFPGGTIGPTPGTTVMDYITMSTKGDAVKFGDQSFGNQAVCGVSSPVRGVLYTGSDDSANTNTLEYITIATHGDSVDFGDLEQKHRHYGCGSNAHGGL